VLPLDGTRGLAVVLVFFVHYHSLFSIYLSEDTISFRVSRFLGEVGHLGVDLFFLLSGYLIYGILIQKPQRYSTFLLRRVKRIYPAFLCVLFVYVALSLLFPEFSKLPSDPAGAALYVLANVALLPGVFPIRPLYTVAWTLSYEFLFYLTVPLLIGALGLRRWNNRSRILLFVILILAHVGYNLWGVEGHPRLVMFLAGILLFEILHSTPIREKLSRRGEAAAIAFSLGCVILLYQTNVHPGAFRFVPGLRNLPGVCWVVAAALGCFSFGLYCFGFDGRLSRVFSLAPIRRLGNISYSYYLIHGLALHGLVMVLRRGLHLTEVSPVLFWAVLPGAFGVTLIAAMILFGLVEQPFSLRQPRRVAYLQTDEPAVVKPSPPRTQQAVG
jgi:peptidoglycan/LPS O-acetylase OafA/YrhL